MPLKRLLSLAVQSVVFFISSLYLAGLTYLLIRATQNGFVMLRSDALMTLEIYMLSITLVGLSALTSKTFYHMIKEYLCQIGVQ